MTNFIFERASQLEKIGEKIFGEKGHIENVYERDISFLQYIIAYRICSNKSINPISYKEVKKYLKPGIPNSIRIFFEKVETCRDDILYFAEVLRKYEKEPSFEKEYAKYSELVA